MRGRPKSGQPEPELRFTPKRHKITLNRMLLPLTLRKPHQPKEKNETGQPTAPTLAAEDILNLMPSSIPQRRRETIASFVSRTAAAFHVDAATFASDKEASFQALIAGASKAVDVLKDFNCHIPSDVVEWSPSSDGVTGRQRLFRGHIFPSKVLQGSEMRGCPECLRRDLEDHADPKTSMAMRGNWLVPHVTLCLEHHHPIVPLWKESKPLLRFDSARHLASLTPDIMAGKLTRESREPTGFETWLDDRLESHNGGTWLDQFHLHAACNYCLMLGTTLLRHFTSAPSAVPDEEK